MTLLYETPSPADLIGPTPSIPEKSSANYSVAVPNSVVNKCLNVYIGQKQYKNKLFLLTLKSAPHPPQFHITANTTIIATSLPLLFAVI